MEGSLGYYFFKLMNQNESNWKKNDSAIGTKLRVRYGSIYSNLLIKMKKNNCVISGRFVRVIFVQTYMNQNGKGIIAPFRLSGGVGY